MDGLIVFFVISFARGFNCYYFLSVHYEPKFHEMKLACNVLVSCVCLLRDVCVFVRSRSIPLTIQERSLPIIHTYGHQSGI